MTKETFGAQCVVPVVFRGRNVLVKWFPGPLCLDEDTRGSACLHVSECRSILIEFICFLLFAFPLSLPFERLKDSI